MGVVVRKVSAVPPIALDRDWGCSADGAVCCTNASSSSAQGCSVETALEAASLHPAQLLGIEDRKGTLNYDSDAGTVMGMVGGRASACCSKAGPATNAGCICCFTGGSGEPRSAQDLLWTFVW